MNEDEFLTLLKTTGKRVQKFHDHPDEYKGEFYKIKYPKKDNGVRLVTSNEEIIDKGSQNDEDCEKVPMKLAG